MHIQLLNKEIYHLIKYSTVNKMGMKKVKITQIKSRIGTKKSQRATLDALGLKKMHQTVVHNATPQIEGMIRKVKHLLKVEYL